MGQWSTGAGNWRALRFSLQQCQRFCADSLPVGSFASNVAPVSVSRCHSHFIHSFLSDLLIPFQCDIRYVSLCPGDDWLQLFVFFLIFLGQSQNHVLSSLSQPTTPFGSVRPFNFNASAASSPYSYTATPVPAEWNDFNSHANSGQFLHFHLKEE